CFHAYDGILYFHVTGVQTCALPISPIVEVKKETPIVVENPQEVAFDFDTNVRNTSKPQVVTGTDTKSADHHEEFIIETIEEEERSEERRVGKECRYRCYAIIRN